MSTGLDFTTLARVKALISETTTNQDAFLQQLITAVSARIEDEMGRKIKKQVYVETYAFSDAEYVLMVKAPPIDTAPPVYVLMSSTADFTDTTPMVANSEFLVQPDQGLIRFMRTFSTARWSGPSYPQGLVYVRIEYTGGIALDTAALIAACPDLAQAADIQVAYLHKRKLSPGGNITVGGGSTSFEKQYGLLDEVRSLVSRYRRVHWF